jgi:Pvc16 N-terminal domain
MSDPLAISGVSAVLQFYLNNLYTGLSHAFGGHVKVTSVAPDLVQSSFGSGTEPENQVNLFMHQVTYNAAWRNVALPSLDSDGKTRLKSPPLALDLHYLLTVYGSADWQAEGLLGYALMMLHENPVLTRDDISYALTHLPGTNNLISALTASTLADQVEMIKITPATLGREEMAWLWTALKADYRPTFPFQVSVVLIQPQRPTSLALPVLRRALEAIPIQPAQLLAVQPPAGQLSAAFNDTVTVTGEFLSGVTRVFLSNPSHAVAFPVPVKNVTNTSLQFVPNDQTTYPGGVPPGIYNLVGQFTDTPFTKVMQSTNALPVGLAPTLPAQPTTAVANGDGSFNVTVSFTPNIWEGQNVSLSLSSTTPPVAPATLYAQTAPALAFTGNANSSLKFQFPAGLPAGALLGRLQVDGVTSQVQVNWVANPPVFTGPMVTITL